MSKFKRLKQASIISFLFLFMFSLTAAIDVHGRAMGLPTTSYGPDVATITHYSQAAKGSYPEMAIGPTGTVSIVYSESDSHDVMYTDNATGTWSTPVELHDQQYINHNNKDIDIDDNGDVHIVAQLSSGNNVGYFTNKSGSWQDFSFGSDHPNSLCLAVEDDGSEFHAASWDYDSSPYTPMLAYYNGTLNQESYRLCTDATDYAGNYVSFTDIAVNSTGYAHIVFRGRTEICYFAVSPLDQIVGLTNLTDVANNGGTYATWPSIEIGDDDKVHVAFVADYVGQDARDGTYYIEVNSTTTPDDAIKIDNNAPAAGSRPKIDVDSSGNVYIGYTVSNYPAQLTNFNTQAAVATNVGGAWTDMMITNFSTDDSSNFACEDLHINPATDQAAFLAHYIDNIELHSMYGGKWGTDLKYSASISGITVDYQGNNIAVTLTLNNTGPSARDFDTVMKINNPYTITPPDEGESPAAEFTNPEGNDQDIGTLDVNEKSTYIWNLHYFGGGEYYVEVGMVIDESVDDRMYFSVIWKVTINADIPGASTILIVASMGMTAVYLTLRAVRKRKIVINN